jgi:hypothetical protein
MHAARRRTVIFALGAIAAAAFAGCGSRLPSVPSDVSVGAPRALPTPRLESNDAPPGILNMHFSTLDVRRGGRWSGEFVTGTSVASIEVRTNLFSVDVPRIGYGRFAFDLDVLDAPPIFVRPYRLRVIARNSAGAEYEQDLPLWIR